MSKDQNYWKKKVWILFKIKLKVHAYTTLKSNKLNRHKTFYSFCKITMRNMQIIYQQWSI